MSHRTQITLTDAQYARLKQESERTGLGLAEMVRRALGAMYGDMDDEDIRTALDESFGAWVERNFNGEAYVEALRPGLAQRLSR